jgi:hypothetical protein
MKEHLGVWQEPAELRVQQVKLPPARHVALQPLNEDFELSGPPGALKRP